MLRNEERTKITYLSLKKNFQKSLKLIMMMLNCGNRKFKQNLIHTTQMRHQVQNKSKNNRHWRKWNKRHSLALETHRQGNNVIENVFDKNDRLLYDNDSVINCIKLFMKSCMIVEIQVMKALTLYWIVSIPKIHWMNRIIEFLEVCHLKMRLLMQYI